MSTGADIHTTAVEVPRPAARLPGRLALPVSAASTAALPAVLVVHEILGFTPHIEALPARLAREGFAALAVNFFVREGTAPDGSSRDAVQQFARALPDERTTADIAAALEFLAATPGVDPQRLALLGFSWGATQSLHANAAGLPLRAVVAFYPKPVYPALLATRPVHPVDQVARFGAPLCAHFGARDRAIPAPEIARLREALTQHGEASEVHVYDGARHGFFHSEPGRGLDHAAAELAWGRTLAFLRRHLA